MPCSTSGAGRASSRPRCGALSLADGGCRFPGCGLKLCDAHHLEHWADGGPTRLDNLVQLCRRHHRAAHEGGFRVELSLNGEMRILRPDGRPLVDVPALPVVDADALAFPGASLEGSVAIDAEASLPSWDGSPLDVSWAVDSLRTFSAGG